MWDRFDIVEAYYCYMYLWHSGGLTERDRDRPEDYPSISMQLHRVRFTPAHSLSEQTLTDNGLDIYLALVREHEEENYPDPRDASAYDGRDPDAYYDDWREAQDNSASGD